MNEVCRGLKQLHFKCCLHIFTLSTSLEQQQMDLANTDRSFSFVWIMNSHRNVSFSEYYIQIQPNAKHSTSIRALGQMIPCQAENDISGM